jgi:hypothetical protein
LVIWPYLYGLFGLLVSEKLGKDAAEMEALLCFRGVVGIQLGSLREVFVANKCLASLLQFIDPRVSDCEEDKLKGVAGCICML